MTKRRIIALPITFAVFALGLSAQPERKVKKPKEGKEPVTQKLEIPREPPMAISAETGKLVFHVSPLSAKGLLSQQVHDALKALDRANGGATIVKLRAFVAGAGDLRRVATIVSEEFSARKLPIPVVSTIQVGALPLEGAQVVIESVGVEKKVMNPLGLVFISARNSEWVRSSQDLRVLRVTCFLSSLDQVEAVHSKVTTAFPMAATNFVQLTRFGSQPLEDCEGVARQLQPPANVGGWIVVSPPKLVFTGLQIAFSDQESDIRLAFERLGKALESQGAGFGDMVFTSTYSLNRSVAVKAAAVLHDFYANANGSAEVFEGLPSLGATVAIEAVAAGK